MTTRTASRGHVRTPRPSGQLLAPKEVIESPETRLRYRIERLLGEGGFGQAYLATRLGRSATVPETVCIKVSARIDGWLREAYFGQLLDGHPRAIRVFDAFPLMRADGAACSTAWRSSTRARRSQRVPRTRRQGLDGDDRAPRDRRHPRGAAASCTAARCCTAT